MPSYVVYIDDSGTKEYADTLEEYGMVGKSQHFVFGAVLISEVESGNLVTEIRTLKTEFFGSDTVEIKSNWLRIPKECKRRYLEPYGLTGEDLTHFVNAYYDIISTSDLKLLAVVVDKVQVQERYPKPYYAPAIAYEVLMQRVVQEYTEASSVSIIIDDMTGATPRGNQYRANLQRHHEQLRQRGSRFLPKLDFAPLKPGIRFVDSAYSHQVQVADIVSYNILRQFREYGDQWETKATGAGLTKLPTYEWFMRLGPKFRQGPNRRVQGYGVIKFPMGKRIPWRLIEEKEND